MEKSTTQEKEWHTTLHRLSGKLTPHRYMALIFMQDALEPGGVSVQLGKKYLSTIIGGLKSIE